MPSHPQNFSLISVFFRMCLSELKFHSFSTHHRVDGDIMAVWRHVFFLDCFFDNEYMVIIGFIVLALRGIPSLQKNPESLYGSENASRASVDIVVG